jgi:predicted RecB family nuclease
VYPYKLGRSVHRHARKEKLDYMLTIAKNPQAKKDIKTRKHLMERSYARSTRYNFDRARWRGLGKVTIQEYLVSAIQNIMALIRYVKNPTRGVLTGISIETIKQISSLNGRYVSLVFSWILKPKLNFARIRVWV